MYKADIKYSNHSDRKKTLFFVEHTFNKHPKLALPGILTWLQSMLFPKHQSPTRYKVDVNSEKQKTQTE